MALTEIAKILKETFGGFDVSGFQEELAKFRSLYKVIKFLNLRIILINSASELSKNIAFKFLNPWEILLL